MDQVTTVVTTLHFPTLHTSLPNMIIHVHPRIQSIGYIEMNGIRIPVRKVEEDRWQVIEQIKEQ